MLLRIMARATRGHSIAILAALVGFALLAGGCRSRAKERRAFRLGYFPNITHAQALVGASDGTFARALGDTPLSTMTFNAGPTAMEALLSGDLDASYVGSGPAINTFVRSKGALRVIAGSASGGAVLVAKTAKTANDLRGKKVASPQLGNTQDIALRHWLTQHGLKPSSGAGGDVTVVPIANPDILTLFRRGDIEAAWVPEPWGTRLVLEGGGHIMVDERDLWPGGKFPTTVLVASKRALEKRPEDIKALLRAHVELTERARSQPQAFARLANEAFAKITRNSLPPEVLKQAMSRIDFTTDPLPEQLRVAASHATELGFLPETDLEGFIDSSLLDEVRRSQAPVDVGESAKP